MHARNPIPSAHPYRVNMVTRTGRVLRTFPSMRAAHRETGVNDQTLRYALENGTPTRGAWWRYADMPDDAQPLREHKPRGYAKGTVKRRKTGVKAPVPKEDPYAPGGRLAWFAGVRKPGTRAGER